MAATLVGRRASNAVSHGRCVVLIAWANVFGELGAFPNSGVDNVIRHTW